MSVINKMLRDLDSRQAQGAVAVPGQGPVAGMTRGTFSVDPVHGEDRRGSGRRVLMGLLLALLLLAGAAATVAWWLWWRPGPQRPAPAAAPVAAVAAVPAVAPASSAATATQAVVPASSAMDALPVAVPASAPLPSAAASATPAAVVAPVAFASGTVASASSALASRPVAPAVPVPPMPEPLAVPAFARASAATAMQPAAASSSAGGRAPVPAPLAATTPAATPAPISAATGAAKTVSAPGKPALVPAPVAKPTGKAESTTPVAALPTARPAQAAAMETLAQAQGLWNAGSREPALETLREAVAAAERANLAAQPGGLASFVMLVRELCRMELAEGHTAQVMALLTRLEPVLADQADVWALRGNTAQRMGRHQDSAAAYLAALKLRPGEPRWMLGAAVSLAAQGQTAAAADWADKARAAGVVSPEVLNYLRQMGVPLR